jgi:3-hydroxypropionyl-CoA synthetase (ADP-forming)
VVSRELGFPLVGKIVSSQIIHKTESGGVIKNIKSPREASTAFTEITARVTRRNPAAIVDGVLFERMETTGTELIIGAIQDPQFGKTLLFGLGGIFVEALKDVTFKLAPATYEQALSMVSGIRSESILNGYRDLPPIDRDAIADILCSTSKLITENSDISELDFNPVIAHEHGAVVVDARILLSDQSEIKTATSYPASSLRSFFKAKSVAVIGASATPGKIGHEILRSISNYDYRGKAYPINPGSETILGLKCYPSITDVPDEIDLAVLTTPSRVVPMVVEQCGLKGVKALVIVSGGFKETGNDHIEKDTISIARKFGIRIIGPNCIGIFDGHSKLDTFFQSHERMLRPNGGRLAFITQSGTFGTTILEWAAEHGVGISKFVSYGNRCDVDEGDLLDFFSQDDETSIIGIYAEGLGNGRKLYDAARKITPRKPIVILKAGKTDLGSKAAKSHTGWLAGSYEIAEAAFEQAGMITSENITQLFDAIHALILQPLPTGSNVAMVTNGAGPCVMAADQLRRDKMKVAELSRSIVAELTSELPPYLLLSETTVDLTGSATSHDYELALKILARDPAVSIMMPFFVFQDTPLDEGIVDVLNRVKELRKPIICCAAGGPYTRSMSRRIEAIGIPVYETAERAVDAAHALVTQAMVSGDISVG